MSARLRNESGVCQNAAPDLAQVNARLRAFLTPVLAALAQTNGSFGTWESRDGLDKDLEMQKEPNGVLISSAGQPSERGRAVDDSNWRFRRILWESRSR